MRRVIVPPAAGLFSAFGLLEADLEQHYVRTVMLARSATEAEDLTRALEEIEELARAAHHAGMQRALHCSRFADLRYRGQAFELTIPVPDHRLTPLDIATLVEDFGLEHERTYGHRAQDEPVEIVNVRLVARIERERWSAARGPIRDERVKGDAMRDAYFGRAVGVHSTAIVTRAERTSTRGGPLIVEEYDATTLVPPGATAWLDEFGSIVIDVG